MHTSVYYISGEQQNRYVVQECGHWPTRNSQLVTICTATSNFWTCTFILTIHIDVFTHNDIKEDITLCLDSKLFYFAYVQDKTEIYLGYLDSTFLFCYAVVSYML